MIEILEAVAVLLLVLYVVWPAAVKNLLKIGKSVSVSEVGDTDIPSVIGQLKGNAVTQFQDIGFEFRKAFRVDGLMGDKISYILSFTSNETSIIGNVVAVTEGSDIRKWFFEFVAEKKGSEEYILVNNARLLVPVDVPFRHTRTMDSRTPLPSLYKTTVEYVGKKYEDDVVDHSAEISAEAIARSISRENEEKRRLGILIDKGEYYELSWRGAFLYTYVNLPPMKAAVMSKQLIPSNQAL